jgi:tetratricopeptide (TPR) repeat protein
MFFSITPMLLPAQVLTEADSLKLTEWKANGSYFLKQKEYERAALYYDSVLKLQPADFTAHSRISDALNSLGMYAPALSHLNYLMQAYPGNADIMYKRACTNFEMKRYYDALADINDYIKLEPTDPEGWYIKGLIQKNQIEPHGAGTMKSFYKKAIKNLEKAIEVAGGKFYKSYVVLGNISTKVNEYDQAVVYYNLAIESDSTKGLPYVLLGDLRIHAKDTAAAMAYFIKSLDTDPDDNQVLKMVNQQFMDLGLYDRVLLKMDSLITLDSTSLEGWMGKGSLLMHQKKFPEAITCFDKAIKYHPGSMNAYYLRGIAWLNLKDKKKAGDDLRYAADFGHPGAKYMLEHDLKFSESWLPFAGEVLKRVPWYLYY